MGVRVKRHPIRGLISGLILAVGVILLVVVYGDARFTTPTPFEAILAAGAVLGLVVGLFGPIRGRRRAQQGMAGGPRP